MILMWLDLDFLVNMAIMELLQWVDTLQVTMRKNVIHVILQTTQWVCWRFTNVRNDVQGH